MRIVGGAIIVLAAAILTAAGAGSEAVTTASGRSQADVIRRANRLQYLYPALVHRPPRKGGSVA
jgi:hypothetical protein